MKPAVQALSQPLPDWAEEASPHLWLPYTQHLLAPPPLPVVGAKSCHIHLADGRKLVDGVANWWTACHGHGHPELVKAVQEQAAKLPHAMLGGLVHEAAVELAQQLVVLTPAGLEHVFFSDSGSTSVEIAMKMAVQYWSNQGRSTKKKIAAFKNAYHGDTMGAMSLCDPKDGMHRHFAGYMPMQYHLDIPSDEYGFAELDEVLGHIAPTTAAVIIEPLVQAAGGMIFHSADSLAEIHRLTKKHGLLLIADEVATGFGRTGTMFACDEAGITPDILCLGKALTGGMMTMGATLATADVFQAFASREPGKAFMHGPTYMANPLASAAALASIRLFAREPRLARANQMENRMQEWLAPCLNAASVAAVRVKGAIGVVEIKTGAMDVWDIRLKAVERGAWLRPFGNILYLCPPLVMDDDELAFLCETVVELCHIML